MALYKLNDAEIEVLTDVLIEHAAAVLSAGLDSYQRARFVTLSRIVTQLHEPRADEPAPFTIHGIEDARSDPWMRAAAESEGIDLNKELGPADPRASRPRCTHGKLFTDDCPACNDRCPHGLTMESPCAACDRGVAVTPSPHDCTCWYDPERHGLEHRILRGAHADTCPLSREGTTAHAPYCPVNRPGFEPIDGLMQCTCDFGPRLAAAVGVPFLVADPEA
jgi:hypothetical protein